uniref:F-box protein AT5G49610-like beta-propeller domain-containing protein n=1 Tax=Leersia perrieri TaxID=77586 RepID=A0A0D9WV06_9ORYZ
MASNPDHHRFPLPSHPHMYCAGAVLCAARGCNHLDCQQGPFLVVFVGTCENNHSWACAYSSKTAEWSAQASIVVDSYVEMTPSILIKDTLYFNCEHGMRILAYDIARHEISVIDRPLGPDNGILIKSEYGGLGFASVQASGLQLWSRIVGDDGIEEWEESRVIELDMLILVDNPFHRLDLVGFAEDTHTIFISSDVGVFTVELKSVQVKEVCERRHYFTVLPYMRFYTPDLANGRWGVEGFLPLEDIQEFGYNRETGFMWLVQKKKNQHTFKKIKQTVSYANEVTAFVEQGKLKKITGVKAKELLIWLSVVEASMLFDLFVPLFTSLLVQDTLYFNCGYGGYGKKILGYNIAQHEFREIDLPLWDDYKQGIITTAEDGGLGFVTMKSCSLVLWSRNVGDYGIEYWKQSRVIQLDMLTPSGNPSSSRDLVGFAECTYTIFISSDVGLFATELKSGQVKMVGESKPYFAVLPYMRFYTPDRELRPTSQIRLLNVSFEGINISTGQAPSTLPLMLCTSTLLIKILCLPMASQIESHRSGAEIVNGDDICRKKTIGLLEELGLPKGFLPLEDIQEFGFNRETGFMWLVQKKKNQHTFKKIKETVSYATEVTAFVEKGKLKKITGVKAKELLIWLSVVEVYVTEASPEKVTFKTGTGITDTFDAAAFALGDPMELMIWDPITGDQHRFPLPPHPHSSCAGAVLCASIDCHQHPFLVVFVGTGDYDQDDSWACVYSSETGQWSSQAFIVINSCVEMLPSLLIGDAVYFNCENGLKILGYDIDWHELWDIDAPIEGEGFEGGRAMTATGIC